MENIKTEKEKDTLSKKVNDRINAAIKDFEEKKARGEVEWVSYEDFIKEFDKI